MDVEYILKIKITTIFDYWELIVKSKTCNYSKNLNQENLINLNFGQTSQFVLSSLLDQ